MAHRPTRVLIVGAGVAAFEATLALKALAGADVEIELLAPEPELVYRPLSVAVPFRLGEARRFPLNRLVQAAGGKLRPGVLGAVALSRKVVVTGEGDELSFDALLLALGARPVEEIAGALTFRGPEDESELTQLLEDARAGRIERIVFAMPARSSWPLPLYELALLTQAHLADLGAAHVIEIVTPERAPLELFGAGASGAICELLEMRGIGVRVDTTGTGVEDGFLHVSAGDHVRADRVVSLPALEGLRIEGIPQDEHGFVATDGHGRVGGLECVWAAGDMTDYPVKQGGLAAQQADAAAESMAAFAGVDIEPRPFEPVLRGLLLTGLLPRFIRSEAGGRSQSFDTEPLWWPPAKIAGRYFAPFLALQVGVPSGGPPSTVTPGVPIEVSLGPTSPRPQ
jgi:sulfide:quinone oxidoreductase